MHPNLKKHYYLIRRCRIPGVVLRFASPNQPGGLMSNSSDRREARRFAMSLPLRIFAKGEAVPECVAHTRDVSYRGLYFLSETEFKIGGQIEFIITLPEQVTRSGDVNIRCRGQIVRVETIDGRHGIAAKIDRYEFLQTA